jgi:hypothetical protein
MQKNSYKINLLQKIIFTILLLGAFSFGYAQDFIYINPRAIGRPLPPRKRPLPPGTTIRINHPAARTIVGKVFEIIPAFLIYKNEKDTADISYMTPLVNIDSVVFADGTVKTFRKGRSIPEYRIRELNEKRERNEKYGNLGSNIVTGSFGVFTNEADGYISDYYGEDRTPFVRGGFSYEKIFLKNWVGVEIAPFFSLNKKGYGGMIHAKFYPNRNRRFRVGVGPFYALYIRDKTTKYYNYEGGYYMAIPREVAMSAVGVGFQFQDHIDKNWMIKLDANFGGIVGYSNSNKKYPGFSKYDQTGTGWAELRLGLGYRF